MTKTGENSSSSGSNSNSNSSSEDEADRFIPKSNNGWGGNDMELEHQRQSFLEHKNKTSAAVDISQFQNHEIGQGYQAKHVVRQRQAPGATDAAGNDNDNPTDKSKARGSNSRTPQRVTDMTQQESQLATGDDKKSSSKKRKGAADTDTPPDNPRTRLKKYLTAPGMVAFRNELESLLSS